ncbi:hypothetical protein SADUNF_Sadunf07G0044800 [Salix dunnii]|uniref:Peptidase C1A papain C-terminal domain-containing protein n=1 Tax=Salix dunnii TaxID=1413687 RepID=A0A835JZD0_9ROSI|nr:hypothetical protein SADUNF_Sadunf07G0044800 [Salix dunnii]
MEASWTMHSNNGGLDNENDYPYLGNDDTCDKDKMKSKAVSTDGYENVLPSDDEKALQKAVAHQPASVAIEASNGMALQFYQSGVLTGGCGAALDHGAVVVG